MSRSQNVARSGPLSREMDFCNAQMLSAGEGWGEGNKSHRLRLGFSPLPNPLPRSIPTITRVHLAGEGTDRATF
jgi:hypothetical protein